MAVEEAATQSTQQSTQSTQEASQEQSLADTDIWGSLIPFNPGNRDVSRIDFVKPKRRYTVGRSRREDVNDISFPHFAKMSHSHCVIEWDGEESSTSAVMVTDLHSSNGTFINGKRVGKGEKWLLRDWNIITFCPHGDRPPNDDPRSDYRFVFRHMAQGERPSEGLYRFYDLQHVLGKGAFATVVKALHRIEGKWYAIKMFPGDKLRDLLDNSHSCGKVESTMKHLRREMSILQRLRHRNICQFKEAFMEGYSISVVLEFVSGGDLTTYMARRKGVLLEPEAQNIVYQVCDALNYIHSMGVVHRDLKPENVLLTNNFPPIVKVADFGLAKVIDSLSMMQTKCGTPTFVAPEVMDQGPHGYDKAVDSWSLGVMLFMMLTNHHPFHNEASAEADWCLLQDYNIIGDGDLFVRGLLEHNPRLRMTPVQALDHPWLARQAAEAERCRTERSLSRTSTATQTSRKATPQACAARVDTARAEGTSRGVKRKAAVLDSISGSLSSLSLKEPQQPVQKKLRGIHGSGGLSPAPVARAGLPLFSGTSSWDRGIDEVPGLGG